MRDAQMAAWTAYGDPIMSSRTIVAANLKALMSTGKLNSTLAVQQASMELGCKVSKSSIDRLLREETPFNLDDLDSLARTFGLDGSWQLLVPGFSPDNRPVLRSVGAAEDALYQKMRAVAKEITTLVAREDEPPYNGSPQKR